MKRTKAYDLPVRIFHWLFAGLFLTSFFIANVIDDESLLYSYHMLSGLMMGLLVILRIIWGILGTQTARFSSLKLRPVELIEYLGSLLNGETKRSLGHNPASSWAAVLMLIFTLIIVASGLMMGLKVNMDFFEDLHELFANALFLVVLLHIAGVILHQLRHRDNIALSMLNGYKVDVENNGIDSNRPIVATFLILIVLSSSVILLNKFDKQSRSIQLFGYNILLSEDESEHHEEEKGRYEKKSNRGKHHDKDNDNDNDNDD
jgi:cytochrome b